MTDVSNTKKITEKLITSPSFRKAFNSDQSAALKAAGFQELSFEELDVMESISSLTASELDALRSIQSKLGKSDQLSEVIGGVIF
jgi:hypothetical protein